eukprot:753009-Amphidinium_carterae.1
MIGKLFVMIFVSTVMVVTIDRARLSAAHVFHGCVQSRQANMNNVTCTPRNARKPTTCHSNTN